MSTTDGTFVVNQAFRVLPHHFSCVEVWSFASPWTFSSSAILLPIFCRAWDHCPAAWPNLSQALAVRYLTLAYVVFIWLSAQVMWLLKTSQIHQRSSTVLDSFFVLMWPEVLIIARGGAEHYYQTSPLWSHLLLNKEEAFSWNKQAILYQHRVFCMNLDEWLPFVT